MCYVFNYAPIEMRYDDILKTYSAGQDMGFNLVLNLETNYYMRYGLSPVAGLGISLVEPYLLPEVLPSQYKISKSHFIVHDQTILR